MIGGMSLNEVKFNEMISKSMESELLLVHDNLTIIFSYQLKIKLKS